VFTTSKDVKTSEEVLKAYAYHNQWCYGTLPLRHLARIIRFQKKAQEYQGIGQGYSGSETDKISALLSLDLEEGAYSCYSDILEEVAEVKEVTGYNGYKGKQVDYKTVNPSRGDNNDGITIIHIDTDTKKVKYCFMNIGNGDTSIMEAEPLKPLTAKEYVSLYYTPGSEKWKGLDVSKILKIIGKTPVLTLDECKELMPVLYGETVKA
jgi:hypothetical protein